MPARAESVCKAATPLVTDNHTLPTQHNNTRCHRAAALWRRISGSRGCYYYPAAVCLLLLAVILRFYDLSGSPLSQSEYVATAVAIGSFPQFLATLHRDSVPIIHPLLLWLLQDVAYSPFSVRAIPATASVLTIAALLFLLPRVGVSRWIAFLVALLMTISVAALLNARDAQEYSLDALTAALMTAGLLLYLRTGRKTLLCAALFLGPLTQYGLALYGAAVLATAGIARRSRDGSSGGPGNGDSRQARIRQWLKQRLDWFWPAAALLAGSAATWLISLRHQWVPGGWGSQGYLKDFYFNPDNPLSAALPFVISRFWDLLSWHLSAVVAALAAIAFGIILLNSVIRRQFHPLLILALFALGIALASPLLGLYPLGGVQQTNYLGLVIVLTAGLAFGGTASHLAAWLRREWPRPALLTGLTLVSLLAGSYALRAAEVYSQNSENSDVAAFYAALSKRLHPGDAVYNGFLIEYQAAFHLRENPKRYRVWNCFSNDLDLCREETIRLTFKDLPDARRIWFNPGKHESKQREMHQEILRQWAAEGKVERIPIRPNRAAWLARDTGWLRERWAAQRQEHQAITAAGPPTARAEFDLYLRKGVLHYHRKPCHTWAYAPLNRFFRGFYRYAQGHFFLKLTPLNPRELPPESLAAGYPASSYLTSYEFIFKDYCWASIPLPEHDYPLAEIRVGQYFRRGPPVWEHTIDLKQDYFRAAYRDISAAEPTAAAVFDLHLQDDALYYYKEPCATADTASRFFLHFVPLSGSDLPPEQRAYGIDNRDFEFGRYGAVFDGKCMARISRPDYPVATVRTGQVGDTGEQIWIAEFHPNLAERYRETYATLAANPPAWRGVFDLYLEGNKLHYIKEQCRPADTAARFLLHIIPADVTDLPAARRSYGMANRDFTFDGRGAHFDGKCMATVELPDYPITMIRTGQFVIGEPPAWSVELAVAP